MFNKVLPAIILSLASYSTVYAETLTLDADATIDADGGYAATGEDRAAPVETADTGMLQNADGTYSVDETAISDTSVEPEPFAVDDTTVDTDNYYVDPNAPALDPNVVVNAETSVVADPNVATDEYMTTDASYGNHPEANQAQAFLVDATGNVQSDIAVENEADSETIATTTLEANNL
ncbi:MAG: hypothetical protein QJT80_13265 [Candidatus Thiocaldithrix dubininis]|uniref:Uncharacterized protein n=1 Tax=Candidatus Thiocaldithrix dubininis TaxID=3080823 RepID=A0AA95H6I4_9GAMM|nr:MAG: hypothetical protein QJT80_13265 [Candidatus Thiocaldithrix dubininis]